MAQQYKFIEDALKKEAPFIIGELRKELKHQQHIASGKLYNGFDDKLKVGEDNISLLITNDTPYMWLVNDGKTGGVTFGDDDQGYEALKEWALSKQKNGQLSFANEEALNRFVNKVKNNLEKKYFTRTGDKNVYPYGDKRYFFIDIAKNKVAASDIDERIRDSIVKQVETEIDKQLIKEEITLTIG